MNGKKKCVKTRNVQHGLADGVTLLSGEIGDSRSSSGWAGVRALIVCACFGGFSVRLRQPVFVGLESRRQMGSPWSFAP